MKKVEKMLILQDNVWLDAYTGVCTCIAEAIIPEHIAWS